MGKDYPWEKTIDLENPDVDIVRSGFRDAVMAVNIGRRRYFRLSPHIPEDLLTEIMGTEKGAEVIVANMKSASKGHVGSGVTVAWVTDGHDKFVRIKGERYGIWALQRLEYQPRIKLTSQRDLWWNHPRRDRFNENSYQSFDAPPQIARLGIPKIPGWMTACRIIEDENFVILEDRGGFLLLLPGKDGSYSYYSLRGEYITPDNIREVAKKALHDSYRKENPEHWAKVKGLTGKRLERFLAKEAMKNL